MIDAGVCMVPFAVPGSIISVQDHLRQWELGNRDGNVIFSD